MTSQQQKPLFFRNPKYAPILLVIGIALMFWSKMKATVYPDATFITLAISRILTAIAFFVLLTNLFQYITKISGKKK